MKSNKKQPGLKNFFLLIFICSTINAQTVSVNVNRINVNSASLNYLQGEKVLVIDTVKTTQADDFTFSLNNKHAGIYRLSFNNNKWIDFINDAEEVNISADADRIPDSIKILSSESNLLYYKFLKLNKAYKNKSELLELILARYPKDDDYYIATQNKLVQLQREYLDFIQKAGRTKPNSFIAGYINSAQLPVIDLNIPVDKQIFYLKAHALDNVDFNNDRLIYSDVFTNKTIEYLTYYRNPQLPKELLEKEFTIAVDTILNKARVNELIYQHITEYLIDGFKKFGFDKVLDYIVENYVIKDDLCLDIKTEGLIKRRIDQARELKAGNPVPEFVIPDPEGKQIALDKINTEKTLVLFYASWCPHCKELLPKIRDIYNQQKEKHFEVIAVSLDTSRADWINYIRNNSLKWLNVSDLRGWDGKAASDYFLYATPTMFLIDKQKRIIDKPFNYEELLKVL